jgi:nitrogen fixation protein FixH
MATPAPHSPALNATGKAAGTAGPFTGWHMTAILVAFFGIVITVNVIMARAAVTTFGGTVVENSYVASQEFNGWLRQARAERALGWQVAVSTLPDRRVAVTAIGRDGAALADAQVTAIAHHPLGTVPQRELRFVRDGAGRFVSTAPLIPGRWQITATVRSGGHQVRVAQPASL